VSNFELFAVLTVSTIGFLRSELYRRHRQCW